MNGSTIVVDSIAFPFPSLSDRKGKAMESTTMVEPFIRKSRFKSQFGVFAGIALAALAVLSIPAIAQGRAHPVGAVYADTNSPSGNAIAVYDRWPDGSLTQSALVPTG